MTTKERKHAELGKRIKEAIDITHKTQADFAREMGVEPSNLSRWIKGEVAPSYEVLIKIGNLSGVSLDRIIAGKEGIPSGGDEAYAYIPLYDVRAAAGAGAFVETEEVKDVLAFRRDWIANELQVSEKDLAVLFVQGDSMTPTLQPGDIMMIVRDGHGMIQDGVFVVMLEGTLLVKRLQRLPGGRLVVKSDNQAYEPFEINLKEEHKDFSIIGRVVWAGRRF